MHQLPLLTHFDPETSSGRPYHQAVEHWKALQDEAQATAYYDSEVFPRSCQRLRQEAPSEPYELLFVPVGTQPYAPILACLANPAKTTVLLHSGESKEYAERVQLTLQSERKLILVRIDEWDNLDIARKIQSVFDCHGQPGIGRVMCDQTGGTKVMSAALSGIAAINGWECGYIQSKFIQKKGSHDESFLRLSSLFKAMGGVQRLMAREFAAQGQFELAVQALEQAAEESLASEFVRRDIARFKLAHAYRQGQLETLRRKLPALARRLGQPLTPKLQDTLEHAPQEGFRLTVARCLRAENQPLAACHMLSQLMGRPCSPDRLAAELRRLEQSHRDDWQLANWKDLDDRLGRALAKRWETEAARA